LRALVVDDSTLFRKFVRDTLAECEQIEVVGVAADGRAALEKIEQLNPDIVTLDVEMPMLNGIQVLETLKGHDVRPEVIMLSAFTDDGATSTTQALRLGAFDFVLKPNLSTIEENCAKLRKDLLPKANVLVKHCLRKNHGQPVPTESIPVSFDGKANANSAGFQKVRAIGIGVSTGGPAALNELLPKLLESIPVPLFIVQHMPPKFTKSLAEELDRMSSIHVCEAEHQQVPVAGTAYIAPGGKQMKVTKLDGNKVIEITDDPPEKSCRPSVDYLFRSLSYSYGNQAMAVIMTGMGNDGTLGSRLMKRQGSLIIAQGEESCVVYGMPRQIVEAGLADYSVPLGQIDELIHRATREGLGVCR